MPTKEARIQELEREMELSTFWDNQSSAQKIIQEVNLLKSWLVPYRELQRRLSDVQALYPEVEASQDEAFITELSNELALVEKR